MAGRMRTTGRLVTGERRHTGDNAAVTNGIRRGSGEDPRRGDREELPDGCRVSGRLRPRRRTLVAGDDEAGELPGGFLSVQLTGRTGLLDRHGEGGDPAAEAGVHRVPQNAAVGRDLGGEVAEQATT